MAAFLRPLARAGSYYSPVSLERLSSKSPWFWIASIWLGVALFDATQTVFVMRSEGMHHAWGRLFITLLVAWLPWAFATPLVMRLGRHHPLSQ